MKNIPQLTSLVILRIYSAIPNLYGQKQKVWLDADTGNEMDDLYAIARVLKDDGIELIGLSSAHYNNPDLLVFDLWNNMDTNHLVTIQDSQRLNEEILAAMEMTHIPHPIGADRQMGRAWGARDPRDSPAAQQLINAARELVGDEILDVLTLGPLTNIASALALAPDIIPKIRVYALAARYIEERKAWSKNEFNVRNDLNAFDYVMDLEGLDLIVMPAEVAIRLQFDREETCAALNEEIPLQEILARRWREANPQHKTRIMWDLALVEAYLVPDLAEIVVVAGPAENKKSTVKIYSSIDSETMEMDFYKVLNK